ncbi:hypothetical protein ONS95_003834 [Cadophora gregata]|uniref:uncharacterized protein n=1 Tax=Cadophora gregata TaxID=51156 RepID=UPI0026DD9C31|nr:uncharacterized protein ONS95_003834 [Cadophora gregata]KAK0107128.1 hypothetical protein ONS95_003834 [Cadophora gregata]KAK0116813.1 hypothetical protein ONS96_012662 [Cadophora gregata f. sp. sojae]
MASTISHKRTSSAADNNAIAPEPKRQDREEDSKDTSASNVSTATPLYVYVVMIDSSPQYSDATSDIHGIYASIKDANNALKGIANGYGGVLDCSFGAEPDGRVFWSCQDAGEGESIELGIARIEVKDEGSEPERKWRDFNKDSDVESGESPAEDEENELDE